MTDIRTKHAELMQRWRERQAQQLGHSKGQFNEDGIVDYEKWQTAPVKVMIANRETNGIDANLYEKNGGMYCIPDAIERSSRGKTGWTRGNTLRVSGQWTYGIQHHSGDTYPEHKEAKKHAFLAPLSAAYINIRKTNGGAVANMKVLHRDTEHYADLLKEQIALINPDVVICGRTLGFLREWVYGEEMAQLDERIYRVGSTVFFAHWHPSARKKHHEMYYRLMDDYTRHKQITD